MRISDVTFLPRRLALIWTEHARISYSSHASRWPMKPRRISSQLDKILGGVRPGADR